MKSFLRADSNVPGFEVPCFVGPHDSLQSSTSHIIHPVVSKCQFFMKEGLNPELKQYFLSWKNCNHYNVHCKLTGRLYALNIATMQVVLLFMFYKVVLIATAISDSSGDFVVPLMNLIFIL
jgi:hypothetical protein